MAPQIVEVVPGKQNEIELFVEQVDFRLQLFKGGTLVFTASKNGKARSFPLVRDVKYKPLYDNNDGDDGCICFYLRQRINNVWQNINDYRFSHDRINKAKVLEFPAFILRNI